MPEMLQKFSNNPGITSLFCSFFWESKKKNSPERGQISQIFSSRGTRAGEKNNTRCFELRKWNNIFAFYFYPLACAKLKGARPKKCKFSWKRTYLEIFPLAGNNSMYCSFMAGKLLRSLPDIYLKGN